eukprot:SAG31_NODE_3295_length_4448_cov_3.127616_4_plen_72_part_00
MAYDGWRAYSMAMACMLRAGLSAVDGDLGITAVRAPWRARRLIRPAESCARIPAIPEHSVPACLAVYTCTI